MRWCKQQTDQKKRLISTGHACSLNTLNNPKLKQELAMTNIDPNN